MEAAETAVGVLGSITNGNSCTADMQGSKWDFFCEFGRTSFFKELNFFMTRNC